MKLKQYLVDHRENLQLAYGIFLIILIPLLIAFNTISIINKYNASMDVALQRKALVVGRSVYAALQDDLDNESKIQQKIEKISAKSSEFENIAVLFPQKNEEGGGYKVVASSSPAEIGKVLNFYYYQNVWSQPDNDALATDSLKLATDKEGQSLASDPGNSGRFWMVSLPMQDSLGNKKAILSMKISSAVIDELTDYNRNTSLYILIVTVIITILFLSIIVRLWDYVVLYRKIKEIDQMKDEFISIASHELRTPLTAIKGYASLISDGTFGPIKNKDMKQSLDRIASSTRRMEELVEDLLNVSRLEQGRLTVANSDVQVEPIIKEITSQLSVTVEEKNLKLSYKKTRAKLPLASADADRLKQVLVNIIGNSVKYTESGSITITSEVRDSKVQIQITDTGMGIPPEAQKRLFKKFYRVKNEKTETIQGTGLGLWITKQIIDLMGGEIYLESIVGQGTQVTVLLPLAATIKK